MKIKIDKLCKAYHGKEVLKDISMEIEIGETICIMGSSGIGKTTFFRILLGLEEGNSKCISGLDSLKRSAVFQENRLLEELSPLDNIKAVWKGTFPKEDILNELMQILPQGCFNQPVKEFSGGMKRRVSIVRAMCVPGDFIVLDEPFTGLDEATKNDVIAYIIRKKDNRTILVSTHQIEDCAKLNGRLISLNR